MLAQQSKKVELRFPLGLKVLSMSMKLKFQSIAISVHTWFGHLEQEWPLNKHNSVLLRSGSCCVAHVMIILAVLQPQNLKKQDASKVLV